MSQLFQFDSVSETQTRFNMDDTYDGLNGVTPAILGYTPGFYRTMAFDKQSQTIYMIFGTKLFKGRLGGSPNVDLLWNRKPLANGQDMVTASGTTKRFGSMDCCGCKVAMTHWNGHDRMVVIYDISSDSFVNTLIDNSTDTFPFYSSLCFDDNGNIYAEFTDTDYDEKQFWIFHNDGRIRRLSDPLDAAANSLVFLAGKVWRLDSGLAKLSNYDPDTDTWTDTGKTFGTGTALHKLSDNELVIVEVNDVELKTTKIETYNIDTEITTTNLTFGLTYPGGGASVLLSEPTGTIDLDGSELKLCICIKISRIDNVIMGFTTHDLPLMFSGVTYKPIDAMQATAVRHELGTGIANLDIDGLLKGTILSSDAITETELRAGIYDGARIDLFLVDWFEPTRTAETIITGVTGEVNIFQGHYTAEVRGLMQRMSQQIGSLTSALCRVKKLGDAECKVSLTSFQHDSSVVVIQGPRLISFDVTNATGYYDYGIVYVTSGANDGLQREIKNSVFDAMNNRNDIALQEAFPYAFEIGDTVTLEAGCDRRLTTCINKFNNILNFRGEPYVPGTDQIIAVGRLN